VAVGRSVFNLATISKRAMCYTGSGSPVITLENTMRSQTQLKRIEMESTTFVRKPFEVLAVEITKDNIAEVAKLVGDLKEKEDGTPFILVDKRLVPNVFRVFPGFWMTKMGDNIRCYSKKIFTDQFVESNEEIKQWVDWMNGVGDEPEAAEEEVA